MYKIWYYSTTIDLIPKKFLLGFQLLHTVEHMPPNNCYLAGYT